MILKVFLLMISYYIYLDLLVPLLSVIHIQLSSAVEKSVEKINCCEPEGKHVPCNL